MAAAETDPIRTPTQQRKFANCGDLFIYFLKHLLLRYSRSRGNLQAWGCITPASTLSVPQESTFGPELYFDMLVEVLTYLDKGLGLAGCPVAGMDKHEGGIFDTQAPMRDDTTAVGEKARLRRACHAK